MCMLFNIKEYVSSRFMENNIKCPFLWLFPSCLHPAWSTFADLYFLKILYLTLLKISQDNFFYRYPFIKFSSSVLTTMMSWEEDDNKCGRQDVPQKQKTREPSRDNGQPK